jgi:hypothetical protein
VVTREAEYRGSEAVQARNQHDADGRSASQHRVSDWLLHERWSPETRGGVLCPRRLAQFSAKGAVFTPLEPSGNYTTHTLQQAQTIRFVFIDFV